jgi:hypothetical protein
MGGGSIGGGASASIGSSGAGRMTVAPTQAQTGRRIGNLRARSLDSTRRAVSRRDDLFADEDFDRSRDFRHFHHRHRDRFADGLFPFGFFGETGTSAAQSDLSAAGDDVGNGDGQGPPFQTRSTRYERPTVETTPSGVTIIRGPGSHRF